MTKLTNPPVGEEKVKYTFENPDPKDYEVPGGEITVSGRWPPEMYPLTEKQQDNWEKEFDKFNDEDFRHPEFVKDFIRSLLSTQASQLREELVRLLDEYPRIEITHKDGSKTKALLEHSIEQWKEIIKGGAE